MVPVEKKILATVGILVVSGLGALLLLNDWTPSAPGGGDDFLPPSTAPAKTGEDATTTSGGTGEDATSGPTADEGATDGTSPTGTPGGTEETTGPTATGGPAPSSSEPAAAEDGGEDTSPAGEDTAESAGDGSVEACDDSPPYGPPDDVPRDDTAPNGHQSRAGCGPPPER
jgi:hypothetical protein